MRSGASSVSARRGSSSASSGNQTIALERWAREEELPADYISSSSSWGVRKPAPAFFDRIVATAGHAPGEIAYVGDRVDNDVIPAAAAGLVAVHLRRGPWGRLQDPSGHAAVQVDDARGVARCVSLSRMTGGLRIGLGVDAHALAAGTPLVLGGVTIDHPRGLVGHSDGDVIAHALTDALLGAAGLADIGALFPSDDEAYRGADSLVLLGRGVPSGARGRVRARQCRLCLDRPGAAHRPTRVEMRDRLATALGVDADRIGVRATTTDELGFTGRGEGLAAQAVALLQRET